VLGTSERIACGAVGLWPKAAVMEVAAGGRRSVWLIIIAAIVEIVGRIVAVEPGLGVVDRGRAEHAAHHPRGEAAAAESAAHTTHADATHTSHAHATHSHSHTAHGGSAPGGCEGNAAEASAAKSPVA